MKKTKLSLQPSEGLVFQVAGRIYSAYLAAGRIVEGTEKEWMERSVREATQIALIAEHTLQSDTELE